MKPHAFVAMPFGTKQDAEGNQIDFNAIYADYIRPALEDAGMEVFRADEEEEAGEIRKDMFFELLVADLVVADLSIDNPNVWYELGVRHALRARGVVLICGGNTKKVFIQHRVDEANASCEIFTGPCVHGEGDLLAVANPR